MAEISALRDEAANPRTDPGRLAALAQQEPRLGAVIAANPAAYDALLDWLAQYGDEPAKHAVAVRRGAVPARAANPFETPAPAATPFAAGAPREPRKRMSKGLKRALVIGIVGTVIVALVAAGGIAYVVVFGWPVIPAVRTADIRTEPRDAWGLVNPSAAAADFDDDLGVLIYATEVGQDRALLTSSTSDGDYLLSLLDTRGGSILWTVDWIEFPIYSLLSERGSTPYVFFTEIDGEKTAVSIDPASGEVISENDDSGLQAVDTSSALDGALGLGGDVLLRTDDGIGRYAAADLNHEKWQVDVAGDDYTVVPNRLIVGEDAYDLGTGERTKWSASEDLTVVSAGRMVLGYGGTAREQTFYRLDERGFVYWKKRVDDAVLVYLDSDVLVIANRDYAEYTAYDMRTGERRWTEEFEAYGKLGGDSAAGILLLRTADDEATAIDLATGEQLYDVDLDASDVLIGIADSVFYLTNEDGVAGYDARSGDRLWTFDDPDHYSFDLVGGNIVGLQADSAGDSEDAPAIIGLQP